MNRRKYILSTLGLGAGLGIASQYYTKPSIATDINLTDNISLPKDVKSKKEFTIKFTIDKFEITPKRVGSNLELNNIKMRGKTNSTEFNNSKSIKINNNIILNNNEHIKNALTETPQEISIPVTFNKNSFTFIYEFIFETENDTIKIQDSINIENEQNPDVYVTEGWVSKPTDLNNLIDNNLSTGVTNGSQYDDNSGSRDERNGDIIIEYNNPISISELEYDLQINYSGNTWNRWRVRIRVYNKDDEMEELKYWENNSRTNLNQQGISNISFESVSKIRLQFSVTGGQISSEDISMNIQFCSLIYS